MEGSVFVYVMRTVSVIAFVLILLFVLGGRMNTSAERANRKIASVTAPESIAQSPAPGTADLPQQNSARHSEAHPGTWLTQFEPLLLLLLGSVLLSVATGIRLMLARR